MKKSLSARGISTASKLQSAAIKKLRVVSPKLLRLHQLERPRLVAIFRGNHDLACSVMAVPGMKPAIARIRHLAAF